MRVRRLPIELFPHACSRDSQEGVHIWSFRLRLKSRLAHFTTLSAMAKFAAVSALAGAAFAGDVALSWTDCGDSSTHGKISDVEPKTLTLGTTSTVTGIGSVDEAVPAGSFSASITAGGGLVHDSVLPAPTHFPWVLERLHSRA